MLRKIENNVYFAFGLAINTQLVVLEVLKQTEKDLENNLPHSLLKMAPFNFTPIFGRHAPSSFIRPFTETAGPDYAQRPISWKFARDVTEAMSVELIIEYH